MAGCSSGKYGRMQFREVRQDAVQGSMAGWSSGKYGRMQFRKVWPDAVQESMAGWSSGKYGRMQFRECSDEFFMALAYGSPVESELKPDRQRMQAAETSCALLEQDGHGTIDNSFSGRGIVTARILDDSEWDADGTANPEFQAVDRLILTNMGESTNQVQSAILSGGG